MKIISVIGICTFLVFHSATAWSTGIRVGFWKEIITPSEDFLPINVGGYLGLKATGYHVDPTQPTGKEELYARSLVLEWMDNGVPKAISLTYLDLVGISNRVIATILTGVEGATGIPPDNQFVGATHTHSAPDLQGVWGGVPDEYKQHIETQTIKAVVEAHGRLTTAEMFVTTIGATNHNRNRRDWGFTDTNITLVVFKEPGPSGEVIGSLLNYAAHPILRGEDNLISRDFCGALVDYLEEHLDTTNPDDVAIFANAVVGDVLPDGPADADQYGESIADLAITAFQSNPSPPIDTTQVSMTSVGWDITVTGFVHNLAYILGRLDYDAYWENGKLKIPTKLGYLRFGNQLEIATFPGESLTRNGFENADGNAIKQVMTANHKMVLGLTGDSLGYFVPSDEWGSWPFSCRNNCYEELLSPGKKVGDDARNMINGM